MQVHQHHRHVISTWLRTGRRGSDQLVHYGVYSLLQTLSLLQESGDQSNHTLVVLPKAVPDAVAAHHNKAVLRRTGKHSNVRFADDELFVVGQLFVVLVAQVADRP